VRVLFPLLLGAASLAATPQLKLTYTTYLPLDVLVGQNGPVQTAKATNIGDGTLSLSASANVPWIVASIAGMNVNMALNTASLAKGSYTGVLTVTAAGAIDSPQTISVTVQMGGGVPDSIDFYASPSRAAQPVVTFFAAPGLVTHFSSLRTVFAIQPSEFDSLTNPKYATQLYEVLNNVEMETTAGTSLTDNLTVAVSTFAPDVKTVPVTLNVTEMPIIDLLTTLAPFNVAQGAAPVEKAIVVGNLGATALVIGAATVTSGADWLTTTIDNETATDPSVVMTADATDLPPGQYTATVTIVSNAANGPLVIPFQMNVVPVGPPLSYYQSVVSNGTFAAGAPVAPGELVIVQGEQFTMGSAVSAQTFPLGTSLGGASVYVNGVAAPIYYVAASTAGSPGGQITFQMPYDVPAGQATVRVDRNDNATVQTGNTISVQVQSTAPALLSYDGFALATFTDYVSFPVPMGNLIPGHPATAGDILIFYGLGFGQTSPPATEGIAADGLTNVPNAVMVFGQGAQSMSVSATPSYCGLTPGSVGLYQVNVTVPAGIQPSSFVPVSLSIGGVSSNSVNIAVQ
jgi:uncharacterized protein (TIGR03437 family)